MMGEARWRARRWFWNRFATFKYDHNHPTPVPPPVADGPVGLVPLASQYRHIPIERALVADRIPADERQRVKQVFSRIQAWLYRVVSPQQRGLPPVAADPRVALDAAYTAAHRRRFPPPTRPAAVDQLDLGELAVASPFACYVTANGDGTFGWDLRILEKFECHPGMRPLGVVVTFEPSGADGRLRASRIDCDAGSCTPSDPCWALACRLAMSAASTHLSLVRHFGWIHLASGGPLAVATRNHLPPEHPVRRLVWPHVYATQYSNDLVTLDQLTNGGDFESIFSLSHRGVSSLIDATIDEFDLGVVDPDVDAARRGVLDLATPSIDNRRQHHTVFLAHRAGTSSATSTTTASVPTPPYSRGGPSWPAGSAGSIRSPAPRSRSTARRAWSPRSSSWPPSSTRSSARVCGTTSCGAMPFRHAFRSTLRQGCRSMCTSGS